MSKTKTGYVIQEIGWEYNDEYYYQSADGGGTARKVFLNKDKAEAERDRLDVAWALGTLSFDLP